MMDFKAALDKLDKTVLGELEWKVALSRAVEKQIPQKVRIGEPSRVKAFDGEDKVLTYRCYPCPECGKWIIENENHKYCQWCGQALDWD